MSIPPINPVSTRSWTTADPPTRPPEKATAPATNDSSTPQTSSRPTSQQGGSSLVVVISASEFNRAVRAGVLARGGGDGSQIDLRV